MTKGHRPHSTARMRKIVEACFKGERMCALGQKYERGELDDAERVS